MADVDEPVRIGFEAVRGAFLAERTNGPLGLNLGVGGIVSQARGGDSVQIAGAERGPVESFPITRQRDAIGTSGCKTDTTSAGNAIDSLAPDKGDVLTFGTNLRGIVKMAPGLTSAKIDNDNTIAALIA